MRYKKLIEIDIDLLTQCLIRTKDNKIVKTEVKEINTQYYNFKDWEFNWVEESKKRNKILGLFAEIARISFEKGYDGYVSFLAKTNLIEHYKKTLGAKQLSYIEMYIDDEAVMKLVKKYYGKYENR